MRFRSLALALCSLVVCAGPTIGRAQFQEPTKEELQMTADPLAPGAAAVYLYREETTDDNLHFHSYYVRIKILTEKGKELATVKTPYEHGEFKVTDIKGRTIHPDGTVIPLTAKPSDLMQFKVGDTQLNEMVFTLPSVEVGSILEYRLIIRYDDNRVSAPTWNIQQPYFVHKAHYYFSPNHSGAISILNSRGEAQDRLMTSVQADGKTGVVHNLKNDYTFDIGNVPPIPDEDWMPPLNSLTWRVEFYYTQYFSGTEFWEKEGKRWQKNANDFAEPTKMLKQAVAEIIAPSDTDDQKARKIYDAVMKLENTDFTRAKTKAELKQVKMKPVKDAEDVWTRKSGSSDEIALLYLAMARAAGLQAYPMQVVNRSRAIFDPHYLSTYQLDDYLVSLTLGGKDIIVDPGQKMCPFGLLHWKHTLASGMRGSAKDTLYSTTGAETYDHSKIQRIADLTVDADGNVTGTARFILTGEEALRWRQIWVENDVDEVKKQFTEYVRATVPDGVQADFDHFLGVEDPNAMLIGLVKISGNVGAATGKHFFLPALFFESHAKHPFVAVDKRTVPIDVRYPRLEQDQVAFHLPSGYTLESLPAAANISWPNHALLKIAAGASGDAVTINRTMVYNYTLLAPDTYADLHGFYQKAATADQEQIVLTRAAAAKGN